MLHPLDWAVLGITLVGIVVYGIWKAGRQKNLESYLLAERAMPWYMVGLSAMATQASAITFLSTTGQGFSDGMRFVQFYFGLPLAMVVLCATAVPIFHRLRVFTAYEYLEHRFDLKTRTLASGLFLLQRGVSTGISIYAPALVLSVMLGVDVTWTNLAMGGLVILYTVTGGVKAVAQTQRLQLVLIWGGMFTALIILFAKLPASVGFGEAVQLAGAFDRLNAVTLTWDLNDRYNLASGLIGGFFLQLSYFGTDQSQVQRYLTGSSITQSRMGLLLNAVVKVPMQFIILFIGAMVFVFYLYTPGPLYYNPIAATEVAADPSLGSSYQALEASYPSLHQERLAAVAQLQAAHELGDAAAISAARAKAQAAELQLQTARDSAATLVSKHYGGQQRDTDYVFLTFVMNTLPIGLVGLLLAVVFLASMGSIAPAFNSLASSTCVDIYQRHIKQDATPAHYVSFSRWATLGWGVLAVLTAGFAARLGSLIEAVNILGSLFYGVMLGIFVVAFYLKHLRGTATYWGAVLAQLVVFGLFYWQVPVSYLWYNVIGAVLVVLFGGVIQVFLNKK